MFLSFSLFEHRCTNKNERLQWDTLSHVKNRIIEFMWAPNAHAGVQFAAVKFVQRVILVQSRGIADPRVSWSLPSVSTCIAGLRASVFPCSPSKLQNKNDPNLAIVPGDHPFLNAAALEAEGVTLLQRLITDLYTKQYVGSVTGLVALTNCMAHASLLQKPGPHIRHSEQLVKSHQDAA